MNRRAALLALVLALAGCGERAADPALRGDARRGKIAVTQYACNACHMIPGVTGSEVYVGRPLKGLGERRFIAGRLPNNQENLMKWIRNPRAVDPETAMPVLGVNETDARDISAYLLSRR
jgi:cytochrome c1